MCLLIKLIFGLGAIDFTSEIHIILHKELVQVPDYLPFVYHVISTSDLASKAALLEIMSKRDCGKYQESVYEQFLSAQSEMMNSLTESYAKIRLRLVHTHQHDHDLIRRCLSEIRWFLYELRYNVISARNEQFAFMLWSTLPSEIPTTFQVPTSVHPVSVPTLYVPFISKVSDANFSVYGRRTDRIHENGSFYVATPQCLPSFVSQPFYKIPKELASQYFISVHGAVESFDSIWVGPSTDLIPCVLAKSPRSYHIIFEATAVSKKQFELKPLRDLLVVTCFLDSICAGYYGKHLLFQGHPVLQFHAADITISTPRQYCHKPLGLEIWFAKGYSLFLVFESSDARDEYEVLLASHCVLPFSKSIFSLCFGSELTKLVKNRANLLSFRDQWVSNKLSSFAYLLILNFFADRSFANYSQYPVMPWVVPSRDLSKPMGQQTPVRGAMFIDQFHQSGPDWHF
jgi:hypothetical protein